MYSSLSFYLTAHLLEQPTQKQLTDLLQLRSPTTMRPSLNRLPLEQLDEERVTASTAAVPEAPQDRVVTSASVEIIAAEDTSYFDGATASLKALSRATISPPS